MQPKFQKFRDPLGGHIKDLESIKKVIDEPAIGFRLLERALKQSDPAHLLKRISNTEDVELAVQLKILPDAETHHVLYGNVQGREILSKISEDQPDTVVIIAPSYGKNCGIGEYARYLGKMFENLSKNVLFVRTSDQLLALDKTVIDGALVLVNHGPGLFDGFNPKLGQGESTHSLLCNLQKSVTEGALPLFLFHSLIDSDQPLLFSRQQQILNSTIPTITFVSTASQHFYIPYTELGISPVTKPINAYKTSERSTRQETIGFFGFFQYGGKDFDSLIYLAKSLCAKLVGSVATVNDEQAENFKDILKESGIEHDFGTGWVTDTELAERLSEADYFYLPQNDYDHWNNSATARFVMNFDKPVFLPPHHPFLDSQNGVIFSNKEDLPRVVSHYREDIHYDQAVARVREYRHFADMHNTANSLLGSAFEIFIDNSLQMLAGDNERSIQRYLCLDAEGQRNYRRIFDNRDTLDENCTPADLMRSDLFNSVFESTNDLQSWRKHFDMVEFVQHSVFEAINFAYRSLGKSEMSIAEILEHCSYIRKNRNIQPPALIKDAIKHALCRKDITNSFHFPRYALVDEGHLLHAKNLTTEIVAQKIQTVGSQISVLRKNISNSRDVFPVIDNMMELLTLTPSEIARRQLPENINSIVLIEAISAALKHTTLIERFDAICSVFVKANVNVTDHFLIDHPLVREIEPKRLSYVIEDFVFFDNNDFILNIVRCLYKRNPFALEFYAISQMLSNLGKYDVISYLSANPSCRANIENPPNNSHKSLLVDYKHFIDHMRDPVAGGIILRNQYLIQNRSNHRWILSCNSTIEEYYNGVGGDYHALLSAYYYLANSSTDYLWNSKDAPNHAYIDAWMTSDGYFHNVRDPEPGIHTLVQGQTLFIGTIPRASHRSLVGFHGVETDGAWTKSTDGWLVFNLPDVAMGTDFRESPLFADHVEDRFSIQSPERSYGATHEFHIALEMRLFGGEHLPCRNVNVEILSDRNGDTLSKDCRSIDNDDPFTIVLSIPAYAVEQHLTVHISVSEASNPSILQGSADTRDLGIMVRSLLFDVKSSTSNIYVKGDMAAA